VATGFCQEFLNITSGRWYNGPMTEPTASQKYWNNKSDAEYMWRQARARAKQRGIPFSITLEDVEAVDTDTCPYLGIPIKRYMQGPGCGHHKPDKKSLDRFETELGYVPGNIVVCSWRANRILSDASIEEILLIGDRIRSRISGEW